MRFSIFRVSFKSSVDVIFRSRDKRSSWRKPIRAAGHAVCASYRSNWLEQTQTLFNHGARSWLARLRRSENTWEHAWPDPTFRTTFHFKNHGMQEILLIPTRNTLRVTNSEFEQKPKLLSRCKIFSAKKKREKPSSAAQCGLWSTVMFFYIAKLSFINPPT